MEQLYDLGLIDIKKCLKLIDIKRLVKENLINIASEDICLSAIKINELNEEILTKLDYSKLSNDFIKSLFMKILIYKNDLKLLKIIYHHLEHKNINFGDSRLTNPLMHACSKKYKDVIYWL